MIHTVMRTSPQGINAIKQWESLSLKAFRPKQWKEEYYTIGYGHYGPDVKPGTVITEYQAEQLLARDLQTAELEVQLIAAPVTAPAGSAAGSPSAAPAGKVLLSQPQFDALVSFVYNVGTAAFRRSTLRRYILAGQPVGKICDQFLRWVYSGKQRLPGLVRRRVFEANMYAGRPVYRYDKRTAQAVRL